MQRKLWDIRPKMPTTSEKVLISLCMRKDASVKVQIAFSASCRELNKSSSTFINKGKSLSLPYFACTNLKDDLILKILANLLNTIPTYIYNS